MTRLVCGMAWTILFALAPAMGIVATGTQPADARSVPGDPKPGEVRKFELARGIEMEFCWIPGGEAQLGSPKAEQDYLTKTFFAGKSPDWLDGETESKRGKYATKGFWLGKYAMTQAEWKAAMKDNPSYFSTEAGGAEKLKKDGIADTSRYPVERVSWEDCQKFLEKVNVQSGGKAFGMAGKFVLPHENEWEYACRGGEGNKWAYHWGNELNGTQANADGNFPYGTDKKGEYKERTTEVGSYAKDWPHPWSLCDMHGNVLQWCENKHGPSSDHRVLRGGSWGGDARHCRAAFRSKGVPTARLNFYGVRVCFRLV